MTERSIPHIRDIFSPASAGNVQQPHDSAVCTSCEDECPQVSEEVRRRKSGRSRPRQETDLKYLERHLSMKKTIRKKMMRDLQQAFVADPEIAKEGDLNSLTFTGRKKEGFLDFLRTGGKANKDEDVDSGRGSPTREDKDEDRRQAGFWRRFTIRRNKR
ncbi:uncharacterized protein [Rhodnius prolixus]|uniref:uncharacterized protein n=1 Tax=Rhodnius prolixus TaxID=13249 RepID=UPI003D18F678